MPYALIYHDVVPSHDADSSGFAGPVAGTYKLTPEHFEAHLEAIAATAAPVGIWRPGADQNVALTFDDGGASSLGIADALERRGWRGHFFITTDRIGKPAFLSADGIRELHARGHAIGSHSHTHPTYFGRLSRAGLLDEWERSGAILAEVLGTQPEGASVPGGMFAPAVAETAAEAGYGWLMTSEPEARVGTRYGLFVAGRYSIKAGTPASLAAAYARGARVPRARSWIEWNAKQAAKRLSPRVFEAARAARARG
jgi:peptidoglycan/xylan/chitin deacetylase (PgdA/CDA1 family)